LTDYTQCDSSAIDSLYVLLTESLPHLIEKKHHQHEIERHITFSINGVDPHSLRSPWWQDDD